MKYPVINLTMVDLFLFLISASVPKICDETGHWQRKEINGQLVEWTNFGTCASSAVLVQKKRAHVHVIAYAVSIIALIPAIILFFVYK